MFSRAKRKAEGQSLLSLSLKHLCYEIKMNNFITSTALLTDKLLSSTFDPELKRFLSMICENLKTKDAQLIRLQNEIEYLREKVNDVKRYTSKDTIIFRNLPLLSNKDVTTDFIEFMRNVLHVEVTSGVLVACHELGRIVDINEPPPIIAKFLYFGQKNQIWGRKKFFAGFVSLLNGKNVHMEERLTKAYKTY